MDNLSYISERSGYLNYLKDIGKVLINTTKACGKLSY